MMTSSGADMLQTYIELCFGDIVVSHCGIWWLKDTFYCEVLWNVALKPGILGVFVLFVVND